jgi:hypothetical protein
MSDPEVVNGYISLERDDAPEPTPAPEPAPEPVAAAPEPEPVPATDDEEPEPSDVLTDARNRQYVPLSALKEAREKNKTLKEQLAQPRGLSADEQRQLESARYLATQLQNRPDIQEALLSGRELNREQQRTVDRIEATAPAPVPPPVADFDDAELKDVAELQGYYTPDGQPDLKAAQKYLGILDRRAAKLADARVKPLIDKSLQGESERQIQQIVTMAEDMGVSRDESLPVLRELARANPAMMVDSPEYGLTGVLFAAGLKAVQDRRRGPQAVPRPAPQAAPAPPPPQEPLLVERSTGPTTQIGVTPQERARARSYGTDSKAYERATERIREAEGGVIFFDKD